MHDTTPRDQSDVSDGFSVQGVAAAIIYLGEYLLTPQNGQSREEQCRAITAHRKQLLEHALQIAHGSDLECDGIIKRFWSATPRKYGAWRKEEWLKALRDALKDPSARIALYLAGFPSKPKTPAERLTVGEYRDIKRFLLERMSDEVHELARASGTEPEAFVEQLLTGRFGDSCRVNAVDWEAEAEREAQGRRHRQWSFA